AFLIASGSANGVADAALETAAKLAATMAASTMFGIRSDIDFTPFFGLGISIPETYTAPGAVFVQIYDQISTSRFESSEALSCAFRLLRRHIGSEAIIPFLRFAILKSCVEDPLTSFRCGHWAATPIKHSGDGRLPASL